MVKIVRLKTDQLELNTGQIAGLPANPRQWTRTDIDKIAKSLQETPELFEMRPCIVKEHEGKYVILGGNLRYTGARQNEDKDVPCVILPKDMPIEKLKEIVVKDNGQFGAWDFDALANEWDELPLTDWGVPAWESQNWDELDPVTDDIADPNLDKDCIVKIIIPAIFENEKNTIINMVKDCLSSYEGIKVQ